MLTLMHGLDRYYFRLHLVCPPVVAEKLAPDLPADVELLPLCFRKPTEIASAVRLVRIIRERRVDILHSHLFYASLFASPIGRLCRVPLILETPHVREEWRRGWKSHFVVDRLVGRFVDYYIAVSEANARYLAEQKGLPPEKVVIIRNGCNLGRFESHRPKPSGLRSRLGFGESDPVLIVVGRLEPQKGHKVLLEALVSLRQEFPRVRLVCVGEGDLRSILENQASELGLTESVRFVGYQTNVEEWLGLADVSVLPSFYEGLPLVAIESLAAGRPVVATAVDGTPEVVVDGKTGLTVQPGDPRGLAEAIARILRDSDLWQRFSESGPKWVQEHYGQEQQIRKTQEFYLEAWEKRKRSVSRAKSGKGRGSMIEDGDHRELSRFRRVYTCTRTGNDNIYDHQVVFQRREILPDRPNTPLIARRGCDAC